MNSVFSLAAFEARPVGLAALSPEVGRPDRRPAHHTGMKSAAWNGPPVFRRGQRGRCMMIFQARPVGLVGLVALPPEVGRPDRRAAVTPA